MSNALSIEQALFLSQLAADVVGACRIAPGEVLTGYGPESQSLRRGEGRWPVPAYGPNATGGALYRPGGRACYPAFWIRDYAMSLASGLITVEDRRHALLLTAHCQPLDDWRTPSRSLVPRGSVPDHITLDGKPIYFPGTVDDYENQGGIWGYRPPLDNQYFFVAMAWDLVFEGGSRTTLTQPVGEITLLDRLDLAFSVPDACSESGLVRCDEQTRGVSFGFTDAVIHTGDLLFCSLLRHQAARQMAQLYALAGEPSRADDYADIAETISAHLCRVFAHESGLLRASSGKSAQPDVWGSAFAVYVGALPPAEAECVCRALLDAHRRGTISYQGNIRHVPTDADYSATSAWEETLGVPHNRYQNGAYWGTPTGWVAYALAQVDPDAALELATAYITELQVNDYRRTEEVGSPLECFHPEGDYAQNPVYMTSVTCPLAAFKRLQWM